MNLLKGIFAGLILTAATQTFAATMACTDYSGVYGSKKEVTCTEIVQTDCTKLTLFMVTTNNQTGTQEFIADKIEKPIPGAPDYLKMVVYFDANGFFTLQVKDLNNQNNFYSAVLSLDPATHDLIASMNENGKISTTSDQHYPSMDDCKKDLGL